MVTVSSLSHERVVLSRCKAWSSFSSAKSQPRTGHTHARARELALAGTGLSRQGCLFSLMKVFLFLRASSQVYT